MVEIDYSMDSSLVLLVKASQAVHKNNSSGSLTAAKIHNRHKSSPTTIPTLAIQLISTIVGKSNH